MARYIDADALSTYFDALAKHAEMEGLHNHAHLYKRCLKLVDDAPTADVAPRAEVDELKRENESLAKTVNEASELIRKQRTKIEKVKAEVAREIFREIDKLHIHVSSKYDANRYAELKKKYTED